MYVALLISGIYIVTMALVTKTDSLKAAFMFNVLPFFAGEIAMFVAAKGLGWI